MRLGVGTIDGVIGWEMSIRNQMQIRFSWASPDQLADCLEVEKNAGTTWSHPKEYFEESVRYQRVLLAQAGEQAVAYLVYEVIWGNTAFLSLLKVLPNYQRQGIGKSMVKVLEERLISLGFKTYVTSSETVNPNTKRFFPDLRFVRIGELQMEHGEEIFYFKKLT